jgi:hypothetical protein
MSTVTIKLEPFLNAGGAGLNSSAGGAGLSSAAKVCLGLSLLILTFPFSIPCAAIASLLCDYRTAIVRFLCSACAVIAQLSRLSDLESIAL